MITKKISRVCGHTFGAGFLDGNSIVVDCGANKGEFAKWISENRNCIVYSFEPNQYLYDCLPKYKNVAYYKMAVCARSGPVKLNEAFGQDLSIKYHSEVMNSQVVAEGIDLRTFCDRNKIRKIDLLKMDIEGAELSVLESLPDIFLQNVVQITVEFHDFLAKEERPKIRATIHRLRKCGFDVFKVSFFDYSDIWCLNKRYVKLSFVQKCSIALAARILPGVMRILARYLSSITRR